MKEQKDFQLVQEKGESRGNPWIDNQNDSHSTAQVVQNLPPTLANDLILNALLKPTMKQIKMGDFPNVVPLKVSYGGGNTEQTDPDTGNVLRKAHKDKMIEFDKSKGFVSTSWANFVIDPNKQQQLTTKEEGIFIKHVTSTVINPNELLKGKQQPDKQPQPTFTVNSSSFTSSHLLSNTWSNVLLYTPKQQVFKVNPETGNYEPYEPSDQTETNKKPDG